MVGKALMSMQHNYLDSLTLCYCALHTALSRFMPICVHCLEISWRINFRAVPPPKINRPHFHVLKAWRILFIVFKGHGSETYFRFYCINRFASGPLHNLSSLSDFGFEFTEIFVIENPLPVSMIVGSRQDCLEYSFSQTFKYIPGLFFAKLGSFKGTVYPF
jgi:hypothetical protein